MKSFIKKDFLLESKFANTLYHYYAKNLPIIDYHSHLSVKDLAENRKFENLTQVWLEGDHYKWRAMRANGIHEDFITGNASDFEKFLKWAYTVPYTMRNPLYHWTHLELKRYFGIKELLNASTAESIYNECNNKLNASDFSARSILRKMSVDVLCTTDDPCDSLEYHNQLIAEDFETLVLPTFRPDKVMAVENQVFYNEYIDKLSGVCGMEIGRYKDLIAAIRLRHDFFNENGCRIADHGIETFYGEEISEAEAGKIFSKIRTGKELTEFEILKFKSSVLHELAIMNFEKNWVQQIHYGALRNNHPKMFEQLGADKGYDSIGDIPVAKSMSKFLGNLAKKDQLTKTIIYNLNPSDNALVASMAGNFNDGITPGKIQFGAAWWFLDQKDGIEQQINALSNFGLLSRFVGMLTDSRSFMSFPRHEYFRRILCNMIGNDVENGLLPKRRKWLGKIVEGICYKNALEYFDFDLSVKKNQDSFEIVEDDDADAIIVTTFEEINDEETKNTAQEDINHS